MHPYVIEQLARIRESEMRRTALATRADGNASAGVHWFRGHAAGAGRGAGQARAAGRMGPVEGRRALLGTGR